MHFILGLVTLGLAAGADLASCAANNKAPECAAVTVDDATINTTLDSICGKDLTIVGCSIRAGCARNATLGAYCAPFSLWADICAVDYAADDRCKTYAGLCGAGTAVEQCAKAKPLPKLVSTKGVALSLGSICSDPGHQMPACRETKCPKEKGADGLYGCDMLADLREVCLTMDTMGECRGWKAMCEATDRFAPACQSAPLVAPPKSTSGAALRLPVTTLLLIGILAIH